MAAIVSLAAINSDIDCCSSKWTIVGAVDIAVKGEGEETGHVLIVNKTRVYELITVALTRIPTT